MLVLGKVSGKCVCICGRLKKTYKDKKTAIMFIEGEEKKKSKTLRKNNSGKLLNLN